MATLPLPAGCLSAQIDAASNQIARYLRNKAGAVPGDIIGVLLLRSPLMVTALLAVLKAGCGYLPLDHHHPDARIEFMLQDASVKVHRVAQLQAAGNVALQLSSAQAFNFDTAAFEHNARSHAALAGCHHTARFTAQAAKQWPPAHTAAGPRESKATCNAAGSACRSHNQLRVPGCCCSGVSAVGFGPAGWP